jgi:hypothetical protein
VWSQDNLANLTAIKLGKLMDIIQTAANALQTTNALPNIVSMEIVHLLVPLHMLMDPSLMDATAK